MKGVDVKTIFAGDGLYVTLRSYKSPDGPKKWLTLLRPADYGDRGLIPAQQIDISGQELIDMLAFIAENEIKP